MCVLFDRVNVENSGEKKNQNLRKDLPWQVPGVPHQEYPVLRISSAHKKDPRFLLSLPYIKQTHFKSGHSFLKGRE
jgi:hypothetical protein